jgi:hypothetical protein
LPPPAIIEDFVVNLGNETKVLGGVGMVQYQAMVLTLCRAQTTAYRLHEPHFRLGRSCHDDAAAIPINAQGEHIDVANHLKFARSELLPHRFPLICCREAIDVASAHTGLQELALDMLGMDAIDGEADGWPTTAMLEPGLDDVGNKLLLVHCSPKLALMVVASHGMDTAQSGM